VFAAPSETFGDAAKSAIEPLNKLREETLAREGLQEARKWVQHLARLRNVIIPHRPPAVQPEFVPKLTGESAPNWKAEAVLREINGYTVADRKQIPTLASTTLITLLQWVLAHAAASSERVSKIIEGAPLPLVREGQVDRAAVLRGSISRRDLEEALRQSGVERIDDTRLIVLEPSGQITVLKKSQQHGRAG
jgi:hypothetical protein